MASKWVITINGVYWGYNPLTNHLLSSWYIQVPSMYGIFTYICHKDQSNVGKYTSPMDGMG